MSRTPSYPFVFGVPTRVLPAHHLGDYELRERVNVGGMAEVFLGYDPKHQRKVAIKCLLPNLMADREVVGMFHDEATITSELHHPNIIQLYDVGETNGTAYLVMEYLPSRDLRTVFEAAKPHGGVPLEVIVNVGLAMSQCLSYAHAKTNSRGQPLHIIHRDMSLQNVLVGFNGQVKLIDFGIAKAFGRIARTEVGTIKGKFGYMSPEQARGLPIDHRTDVFSLGICLWELAANRRLFYADNDLRTIEKIRACKIPRLTRIIQHIPKEFDRIARKALAKDADDRYPTASELFADLSAFAHNVCKPATPEQMAAYVQQLFPDSPGARDDQPPKQPTESPTMADKKGGSDLDVFDGLAKKSGRKPSLPPPTGGRASGAPLPPPGGPRGGIRAKTMLGLAPPPAGNPLPPKPSAPPSLRPGAPLPPPGVRPSGPLPPVSVPPAASRPPPPLAAPPPPSNALDMDWDDDDEKTAIYDKSATEEALNALKAPPPAAGMPAAPPPAAGAPASMPPAPATAPPTSVPPMAPVPARAEPTQVVRPQQEGGGSNTTVILAGLVAVVGIAAAAYFLLMPKVGTLIVEAKSGTKSVKATVSVDGKKACDSTPCRVENLKKGTHNVEVKSEKFGSNSKLVKVEAGEESPVTIALEKDAATPEPAAAGTGIKVKGPAHVKLSVDGKEVGPLPQELKDLKPGKHKFKFASSDRYKPVEKEVTISKGKIEDLGDIKLKVLKGTAKLVLVTTGAKVTLVSGKTRKSVRSFPITIDIDTSKKWSIEATKTGFETYKQDINFDDGEAEKTFSIDLNKKGEPKKETPKSTGKGGGTGKAPPTSVAKSGKGTLNLNSIPQSAVVLDNRPIGRTPKIGVSVSAGSHTVVFIHPEKGRRKRIVTVRGGQKKSVGVKF